MGKEKFDNHGWIIRVAELSGVCRQTVSKAILKNAPGPMAQKARDTFDSLYGKEIREALFSMVSS